MVGAGRDALQPGPPRASRAAASRPTSDTAVEAHRDALQRARTTSVLAGDEEHLRRGKRMLGLLQGTLSKFREEDSADAASGQQRAIQAKLSQRLTAERTALAGQLEAERAERLRARADARAQRRPRAATTPGHLQTATAPALYYRPAVLLPAQQAALDAQAHD